MMAVMEEEAVEEEVSFHILELLFLQCFFF